MKAVPTCPKCDALVDHDAVFYNKCSNVLRPQQPVASPSAQSTSSPSPSSSPTKDKTRTHARALNLTWAMPRYVQEEILPFIPEEKELDELIAASRSQRMTAHLQTLKETMADPTEALRLRWIDINENIISINTPVKGHRPRQLEVSSRLIAMLNSIPKTSELIFPTNYRAM